MFRRLSYILKKHRILITFIICVAIYMIENPGNLAVPIESLDIPSGIGIDLAEGKNGMKDYLVTIDAYTFNKPDQSGDVLIDGTGRELVDTRESRQLKSNHKFIYGLEKVMLLGEGIAKHGIENSMDILFGNPNMHDLAWLVVTKGKAIDVMKAKIADYPTSSDYIKGMIDNCKESNFFSDNYKIMDAYVRIDAEGRNLVLPYIEVKDGKILMTGVCIFKKDKMVDVLNEEDTKYLNFMRENNVRGILNEVKSFDKQISMAGKETRKVSCEKISKNKYIFNLNIVFKGDIVSNSLYKDLLKDDSVINKFEKNLGQETEERCNEVIDKMQNEFKTDCLEFGRVAAAKYGRDTGVDWDEIVSNSKINVKVKIKVDKFGRGEYTIKP